MWGQLRLKHIILLFALLLAACGSDNGASVGGSDPVTASGHVAITGSGVAEFVAGVNGFSPNIGAEIINASNPYTLKFDETRVALNMLYMENTVKGQTLYTLSMSQIYVSNSGVPGGSDWEASSTGAQIAGVVLDKAAKSITFNGTTLTSPTTGSVLVLNGTLTVI